MSIDVRTLLLYKLKPTCKNIIASLEKYNRDNLFVTVGNYDAMTIYPTYDYPKIMDKEMDNSCDYLNMFYEEKKLLTKKYLDNETSIGKHTTFYHPVHLVRHCDENHDDVNRFWHLKKSFLVVTFIYGMLEKDLKELEKEIDDSICLQKNIDVEYLTYRSINMSRLVIVWKGDQLNAILNMISKLSTSKSALSTHTICGFRFSPETNSITTENVSDKDIIEMVKITGIIKSHKKASLHFDNIKSKLNVIESKKGTEFLAYGNNDFNLIYRNIKTLNIIELLNDWMNHKARKNLPLLEEAFFSVKTRLHTDYNNLDNDFILPDQQEIDKLFLSSLNTINQFANENSSSWAYNLIETINMLRDMSQNPTLSRAIFFVADSLKTFTDALQSIKNSDNSESIMFENLENIIKYTNAINSLINQLVRVDGYLSQEPGFSPLIFDMIPAGVLGFYYSFIRDAINNLKITTNYFESNTECNYSMLLIPTLARSIKIDNVIFRTPMNQTPVFPKHQIYLVEIPYDILYKPSELLCAVTHEIMHFCGESIRCRKERYNTFLSFVAEALALDFRICCQNNQTTRYIFNYLKSCINYASEGTYLQTLIDKTKYAVTHLYTDVNEKNNLVKLYLSNALIEHDDNSIICSTNMRVNNSSLKLLVYKQVESIAYLFKECYADLMTFKLLKLSEDEYLDMMLKEMYSIPNDDQRIKRFRQTTLETRLAVVLYVWRKELGVNIIEPIIPKKADDPFVISNINKLIFSFDHAFNEKILIPNNNYLYFPIRCLMNLIEYLNRCCETFEKLSSEDKELLSNISKHYDLSKNHAKFFDDDYCKLIDEMTSDFIIKDS